MRKQDMKVVLTLDSSKHTSEVVILQTMYQWKERWEGKSTRQNHNTQVNLNVRLPRCNEKEMALDELKHILGP